MKKILPALFFGLLFFLLGQSVLASIAPPQLVVNHETKECAIFYAGDECVSCSPAGGWEIVDSSSECPSDYTAIGELSFEYYVCEGRKTQFCCTVNHSGVPGDCENVVVNHSEKKCAFVEDINKCEKLPAGWESAEFDLFWGQVCPSLEYEWIDDIKCVVGGATKGITVKGSEAIIDYPVYIILLATIVAASLLILWFLFRKKK